MTNANGNGAAANGAMHAMSTLQPKFDAAAMTAFWMSGSARLMRSSEVFMRGMTEVARLEAELGQQFLQRGMIGLRTASLGAKPDQFARAEIDQAALDVDSLITTMRKIADEFRHTIHESTQALFDVAGPQREQSVAASVHSEETAAKRRPAPGASAPSFAG
jgi:hypothetical protein